jgi:rhodanese-related sulfurtransferase
MLVILFIHAYSKAYKEFRIGIFMNDRILSSEQALEKTNNASLILLDIRRVDEWQATGIPQGAVGLTMDNPLFIQTLEELTNHDKNKPIAICAAGGRSARVCQALQSQGYNFIFDVAEGVNGGQNGIGWLNKNLPMITYTA